MTYKYKPKPLDWIDRYERSALGWAGKRAMVKRCQVVAASHKLLPLPHLPSPRRNLCDLLVARYGENMAKSIMGRENIPVPKEGKTPKKHRPPGVRELSERAAKYYKAMDEYHEHVGTPQQQSDQPKTPATDNSLDFPPIPSPTDDEQDLDHDAIFEPRAVVKRGRQSPRGK